MSISAATRERWAAEVEKAPQLCVSYNAEVSPRGFVPGVLWPLLRDLPPKRLELVSAGHREFIAIDGCGHGVPYTLRDKLGLPLFPALQCGRALRDKLPSLRPAMWASDGSWRVDLLCAVQVAPPKDIAALIRGYGNCTPSMFPGLP